MRTFHCEKCHMTLTTPGSKLAIEHCSRCGTAVTEVPDTEAPAVTSMFRFDTDSVCASFRKSLPIGAAMANEVLAAAPTPMDAAVMAGGMFLYFAACANVNPMQFIELMYTTVGGELGKIEKELGVPEGGGEPQPA